MALYREVRGQTDPNYDQTDLYNAAETIKSIKVNRYIMPSRRIDEHFS